MTSSTVAAWRPTIDACDDYLASRTGCYEWRQVRYLAAGAAMLANGLSDADTVVDVGAGWTEFDFCLRQSFGWRGRYYPVDGGLDGTDLNVWTPAREAEWFVALEILEHLRHPMLLVEKMKLRAGKGIVVSTPNPRTTDVLGMDPTHVTPIDMSALRRAGFVVREESFYGQPDDSLFGVWRPPSPYSVIGEQRKAERV